MSEYLDEYKHKVEEAHKAIYGAVNNEEVLNESVNKVIYSTDKYCVTVPDETSRVSNKNQIHIKIYNNKKPNKADKMSRLNPFTGEIILSHAPEGGKKNVSSLAKDFYKFQDKITPDGTTVLQSIADTMKELYNMDDISPDDFVDFKTDLYEGRKKR